MKVIVTGATGVVGKEIVNQLLADTRITKIVILTRRAVSGDVESNPKAEVRLHQDYLRYSSDLMRQLEGAEACIWAIGGRLDQPDQDKELFHNVTVDYPLAAAQAMCTHLTSKTPMGKKFRFVYCSSKTSEKKALLFPSDTKRIKAEAEKGLCDVADSNSGNFSVFILRPGGFATASSTPKRKKIVGTLTGSSNSSGIELSQLGKAAVKVACEGWKERAIDNEALVKM